jgi:uncharacterized protein (TIGR03083 family)
MSTPSYSELVAAVRQEGTALVAAARQGVDASVPTCGDWLVSDLLGHIGRVYSYAAILTSERVVTTPTRRPDPPEGVDLCDYVAAALDDLVEGLSSCDPDTPVWNWSDQPHVAAFWARRMTHESTVHRYDTQRAHGVAQPIDPDLAHDGMDELVDVLLPRVAERDGPTLPEATFCFTATDEGTWAVHTGASGVARAEESASADVTVRGTASALQLATYNRVRWTSLEVEGDAGLLDMWSTALRF